VVLPYYLHDYKAYGKVTILGEFLAIASVVMCITFILVDLGQPMRVMNVCSTPRRTRCCSGNGRAERLPVPEPHHRLERARGRTAGGALPELAEAPDLHLDPWAVSIHTVTAYLYCGLPGRGFWLTAILARDFCPRPSPRGRRS